MPEMKELKERKLTVARVATRTDGRYGGELVSRHACRFHLLDGTL
jgi:hypothetical protein